MAAVESLVGKVDELEDDRLSVALTMLHYYGQYRFSIGSLGCLLYKD